MIETLVLKSDKFLFSEEEMKPLIKSYSFCQDSILQSIIHLYIPSGKIECDPCYRTGGFYKSGKISAPEKISDINPIHGVPVHDCRKLPYENNSTNSLIFDPPFITYPGKKCLNKLREYGSFRTKSERNEMYNSSFIEFNRIFKKNGILIVKCQDSSYGPDIDMVHIDSVILPCRKIGFTVIEFGILLSKGRIERRDCIQKHLRKYHSYFVVFKKI